MKAIPTKNLESIIVGTHFGDIDPNDKPSKSKQSSEGISSYPALQIDNVKPRSPQEPINFCLSESSVALIANCPMVNDFLTLGTADVFFPKKPGEKVKEAVSMFLLPNPIRLVFLAMPRMVGWDKKTNIKSPLLKGEKLKQSGRVTICRPLVAVSTPKGLLLDAEGNVQVFTLSHTHSKRTGVIGNYRSNEPRTLYALNESLNNAFKTSKLWHAAYYSIGLEAIHAIATSGDGEKESETFLYQLVSPLSPIIKVNPSDEDAVDRLINSKEFIKRNNDPFGTGIVADDTQDEEEPNYTEDVSF